MSQTDSNKSNQSLSYRDAGVDIDAGNQFVEQIKSHVGRTKRPEVIGGLGGFAALFEIPLDRYKKPVLVSGTDGVGTKLKLALQMNKHDTIGIDLVAMCVNDILVVGAEPLYFLDYYATGKLDNAVAVDVIKGIAEGCVQAGAALTGGETAEMPGMYRPGDFDLAGFCVAVAEKNKIIDGSKISVGDVIVALPSSGAHSNGYSLIRKILSVGKHSLSKKFGDRTLADALLAPTQIYVKPVLKLIEAGIPVRGMSHITGGGITENLTRAFPKGTAAVIDTQSWQRPALFNWLQEKGAVEDAEMRRVFNCGVGFALVIPRRRVDEALRFLKKARLKPWVIGEVIKGKQDVRYI